MEETLLTAARRVVRFFNIDNTLGGGLISVDTSTAVETLDKMVRQQDARDKALREGLERDFGIVE